MAHVDRQPECEMSSNPERSSLLPPYAAPVASPAELPRVASAALSTPFVPPSWRTAEHVRGPAEALEIAQPSAPDDAELPWIEAFADDSYAGAESVSYEPMIEAAALEEASFAPMIEATAVEEASFEPSFEASFEASVMEDAAAEYLAPEHLATEGEGQEEPATPEQPAADDAWAIADVSEHIARLAEELAAASKEPVSAPTPMPPVPTVSHTPWQDDDAWMDIMPALPNSGARDMAAETEWARAFGEPPAPMSPPPLPTGDQQAAAASLESIARRLRSGELQVPGFVADRGDAAALAAALASLLGARP